MKPLLITDSADQVPYWATFDGDGPFLRLKLGHHGLVIDTVDEDRLRNWLLARHEERTRVTDSEGTKHDV